MPRSHFSTPLREFATTVAIRVFTAAMSMDKPPAIFTPKSPARRTS